MPFVRVSRREEEELTFVHRSTTSNWTSLDNTAFFQIIVFSRFYYVLLNVIFSLSMVQAMEIFMIT